MKSQLFKIEELVPKEVYQTRGDKAWELLDPNMIKVLDRIKKKFPKGSMTVNNWLWNGDRNWSGLRTPESPYYSKYSQHSFGRAFDAVFSKYTAEEVRQYIIDNLEEFPEVGGIELGISWLHIDVRNVEQVKMFYP